MKKTNNTITTIGHSNVSIELFLKTLIDNKIQVLVDVRTTPLSRFCPHFNQKALQRALSDKSILYLYRGRNLGGRSYNQNYEETIDEISDRVKAGERMCVMCSEKDYLKCHRYTVLTPSFEERGVLSVHIKYDEK